MGTAAAAVAALLLVVVAVPAPPGLPSATPARARPPAASALPTLRVDLDPATWRELYAEHDVDDEKHWVTGRFADETGTAVVRVALRGYSPWHHGPTKPSLRIKAKGEPDRDAIELQRPEDVLGVANALPDAIAGHLGLLHAATEPVRVFFGERFAGVYLRSRRPGRAMALAAHRPSGTFFKGDNLGARSRLDLWRASSAWRTLGDDDPRATACLDELLAILRQPPSAARNERLWQVLDFEATAKVAALAALVGSIHADRTHNQLLFFTPSRGTLEPVLWDANGLGVHAGPDVPVDAARHPLMVACTCDPRLLHRRDQILWQLLHELDLDAMVAAHRDRVLPDLRADPEPGRLEMTGTDWRLRVVDGPDIEAAAAAASGWLEARSRHLLAWLADARVSVVPHPRRAGWSLAHVHGNVAVMAHTGSGAMVGPLFPARSLADVDRPQRPGPLADGIPVPHPTHAPMPYELDQPPAALTFTNAITGAAVAATSESPPAVPIRSAAAAAGADPTPIELGPGEVELRATLVVPAGGRLTIVPGTTVALHAGAGIVCSGELVARGTEHAPIRLRAAAGMPWGALVVIGARDAVLEHVVVSGGGPLQLRHRTFAGMVTLYDCRNARLQHVLLDQADGAALAVLHGDATLDHVRIGNVRGDGIVVEQGRLIARDSRVACCWGAGVAAGGGTEVRLQQCELTGCAAATAARDGGRTDLRDCRLDPAPAASPR